MIKNQTAGQVISPKILIKNIIKISSTTKSKSERGKLTNRQPIHMSIEAILTKSHQK
jgi:hypothetical protein